MKVSIKLHFKAFSSILSVQIPPKALVLCVFWPTEDQLQADLSIVVVFFFNYSIHFGVLKYKCQISAPSLFHLYKIDPTNVRTDENTVPSSIKWSLINKTVQNLKKK